jgi:hypothetical protein
MRENVVRVGFENLAIRGHRLVKIALAFREPREAQGAIQFLSASDPRPLPFRQGRCQRASGRREQRDAVYKRGER